MSPLAQEVWNVEGRETEFVGWIKTINNTYSQTAYKHLVHIKISIKLEYGRVFLIYEKSKRTFFWKAKLENKKKKNKIARLC